MFDGETKVHLLDWSSTKIHRKVKSTLAAEAAGASRGYDRVTYCRALIAELEFGSRQGHWTKNAAKIPCGIATDCRSLYDLCNNLVGLPDERRVALDLLDVKEGLEENQDQIRWVPTEHMLANGLTKKMPPDFLLAFLKE